MIVTYEGDVAKCERFLQEAQLEYRRLADHPEIGGSFSLRYEQDGLVADVTIHTGRGLDRIHIRLLEELPFESGAGKAPHILSGAAIMEAQTGEIGMTAFAPTINTKEQFSYPDAYLIHPHFKVPSHVTMPARIQQMGRADTQYTIQRSSMYTGKMCKLVQVILSYGTLSVNSAYTQAINQFLAAKPPGFTLPRSVLWVNENQGGVQNTFNWEYGRTHGVYTNPDGQHWLIEISASSGVKAMPLQLEPVTTMPEFYDFVEAESMKANAKGWWKDILAVLDEFGGFPSNQAFVSKEQFIKDQIVTLLPQTSMGYYTNGRGATQDVGWAFNSTGDKADNVCFESMQGDSWLMAHHCRVQIGWDTGTDLPTAVFYHLESGAGPLGEGRFKVGSTLMEGCVSYNLDLTKPGNYSERPKAVQTPMHVFWKRDRLEILRWSDGEIQNLPGTVEVTTGIEDGAKVTRTRTWTGGTGIPAGFFCTQHDARVPHEASYHETEDKYKIEHERERRLVYDPATDDPEYYVRNFYSYHAIKEIQRSGWRTDGCSAWAPLGDRSAFYIATMVTKGSSSETLDVTPLTHGDPYAYLARSTYIWNWDFGTQCGKSFPVTYAGITAEGLFYTVWDRNGGNGEAQANKYCDPFIWGPMPYKGHPSWYAWTPEWQKTADEWTEMTGQSEWFSPGVSIDGPDNGYKLTPYAGGRPTGYNKATGEVSTLTTYLVSMHETKEVFKVVGAYLYMFVNYFYWFDKSPNDDGILQNMWAFNNRFGDKSYQLYSVDVNAVLTADPSYQLPVTEFPTFIGVVGTIPAP